MCSVYVRALSCTGNIMKSSFEEAGELWEREEDLRFCYKVHGR